MCPLSCKTHSGESLESDKKIEIEMIVNDSFCG